VFFESLPLLQAGNMGLLLLQPAEQRGRPVRCGSRILSRKGGKVGHTPSPWPRPVSRGSLSPLRRRKAPPIRLGAAGARWSTNSGPSTGKGRKGEPSAVAVRWSGRPPLET